MEWILNNLLLFWIIVSIVCVVIEALTVSLTTIWFAGGGLLAALSTIFTDFFLIQAIIFVVTSTVLLIFTRPFFSRNIKGGDTKTNVDSLIGKSGKVITSLDSGLYQAKVGFEVWTVREMDGLELKQGDNVIVDSVEGVKLIVKKED